ncbi:hypothetical protein OJAV_G00127750 [Oryzias javanicus]|uniref:Uncharacterized protein n=1 Tax=Oryzias javanicus TaxID=123683 RepID=A0A3S2U7K0_ORYJA|nr:hypothetical protein OJAV_G00127750 [Oryzias javanicus]
MLRTRVGGAANLQEEEEGARPFPRSLTGAIVMVTRPPPRHCLAPCQVYYKHTALSYGAPAQSELQSRKEVRSEEEHAPAHSRRRRRRAGKRKALDYCGH